MGTLTVTVRVTANQNANLSSSVFPQNPTTYPSLSRLQTSPRVRVGVWAYMERNPNSIGSIASKLIGSLRSSVLSPGSSVTKAATSSTSPSSGGRSVRSVGSPIQVPSTSSKTDAAGSSLSDWERSLSEVLLQDLLSVVEQS